MLEIEIEIGFAKIDLHLDCLDRRLGKFGVDLASISIFNRDRQHRDFNLRSFPPRSNNVVVDCLRLQVPLLHHQRSFVALYASYMQFAIYNARNVLCGSWDYSTAVCVAV